MPRSRKAQQPPRAPGGRFIKKASAAVAPVAAAPSRRQRREGRRALKLAKLRRLAGRAQQSYRGRVGKPVRVSSGQGPQNVRTFFVDAAPVRA